MAPARRPAYVSGMIKNFLRIAGPAGLVAGAGLLVALTGCSKSQTDTQYVSAPPAAVPAQPTAVGEDDYVYYPSYEIYYSRIHHNYRFREGNAWVTRSAPPRISVDVLFASPSVRMDFHDAPERHHENIVRSYPKNWAPPGAGRGDRDEHKDDRKDQR
jgi:hypothetical protein